MREPPPRAGALETRGSQFDFALNSRNAADRARFSCSLCPQPFRSRRRELLKCLEMLRLKTPSSRSKSPRTRNEPPKPRSGTPKTGSKSLNSRAAHAIKCYGSSESRRARRRAQSARNTHGGIVPLYRSRAHSVAHRSSQRAALFMFVNVRQYS